MSIESDHVNLLVYRYLQESGFQHSSFTFAQESGIASSSIANVKIPAGSLIAHLQRALNYVQAEVNLTEDGLPADVEDLETIEALTLIESVQPEVCEQRRQQLRARLRETAFNQNSSWNEGEAENTMEVDMEISADKVKILKGHQHEVTACTWNPCFELLASASGDSTSRIWSFEDGLQGEAVVLRHFSSEGEESKDVTTLDWSPDGMHLATGSYDGAARVWSKAGELLKRLSGHSGPIFSLKWNRTGELLVTSSVDCTAVVWDISTGQSKQTFAFHTAPCLDVDWQSTTRFASCSTDRTIYICEIGNTIPIKNFKGHEDEVNSVKWDTSGRYLASCSDDCTAKTWSMDRDTALVTLRHTDKIFSLKWGPHRDNSAVPYLLASASSDQTVKLWNAESGVCLFTLAGHRSPVYSVDFSANGLFLASGSFDKSLLVWSVESGELLRTYHGSGGIFEVCWNNAGTRIAASYSDHNVAVIEFSLEN